MQALPVAMMAGSAAVGNPGTCAPFVSYNKLGHSTEIAFRVSNDSLEQGIWLLRE